MNTKFSQIAAATLPYNPSTDTVIGVQGGTTDVQYPLNIVRTVLTGNLSLYVNASTGSDSYNGLSATYTGGVNGPFATWGKAAAVAGSYDYGSLYFPTITIAAGTYPEYIAPPLLVNLGPGLFGVINCDSGSGTIFKPTTTPPSFMVAGGQAVLYLVDAGNWVIDYINLDASSTNAIDTVQLVFARRSPFVIPTKITLGQIASGAVLQNGYVSLDSYVSLTAFGTTFDIDTNDSSGSNNVFDAENYSFYDAAGCVVNFNGTLVVAAVFSGILDSAFGFQGATYNVNGSLSGPSLSLVFGSAFSSGGTLTPSQLPGTSVGTVDGTSTYDGDFLNAGIGAATGKSLALTSAGLVVYANNQPLGGNRGGIWQDNGSGVTLYMQGGILFGPNSGDVGGGVDTGIVRESAGLAKITNAGSGYGAIDASAYSVSGTPGISATIVTAKLTGGGSNGSMTFINGILTAQTSAT